jgi:hypothetical protein
MGICKDSPHLLDSFPVGIVIRQMAEVPELQLQSRHFRGTDPSVIAMVRNTLPLREINAR